MAKETSLLPTTELKNPATGNKQSATEKKATLLERIAKNRPTVNLPYLLRPIDCLNPAVLRLLFLGQVHPRAVLRRYIMVCPRILDLSAAYGNLEHRGRALDGG
uniref:Uncharacterized protein n=1 Tax=Bionectria ochroleuca TaxID=29856 RepID=A0A8H7N6B3_BIOOC